MMSAIPLELYKSFEYRAVRVDIRAALRVETKRLSRRSNLSSRSPIFGGIHLQSTVYKSSIFIAGD